MCSDILIRRVPLGSVHQTNIHLSLGIAISEVDAVNRLGDQAGRVERTRSQVWVAAAPVLRAGIILVEKVESFHIISGYPVPEERLTVASTFDGHLTNVEGPVRLVDHDVRRDRPTIPSFRAICQVK